MNTTDWALTLYQQCAAETTIVPEAELTTEPEHVWYSAVERGPGIEHVIGVGVDVLATDPGQLAGRMLVARGAGGGAERQRVGQDGAHHEARDVVRNLHALLVVHAEEDRAGASHGFVAEEGG